MSQLDAIKDLWARTKAANHNTESLTLLLTDYTKILGEVIDSGEDYRVSLRRLREELPDLQRLVTKKHDPILKGRLQDAINTLKKKVEAVEAPPIEETPAKEGNTNGDGTFTTQPEEPRRPRNMPTLGMD